MHVPFFGPLYRLRRNGYSGPFFMALSMFAVGVQFLIPNDSFGTSSAYDVMASWADERTWGLFLIACSSYLLFASLSHKPERVSIASLFSAFGWLVMWVSVVLGNPYGALMPMLLVMVMRSMSLFREFADRRYDPHLLDPERSSAQTYPREHPPSERPQPPEQHEKEDLS